MQNVLQLSWTFQVSSGEHYLFSVCDVSPDISAFSSKNSVRSSKNSDAFTPINIFKVLLN